MIRLAEAFRRWSRPLGAIVVAAYVAAVALALAGNTGVAIIVFVCGSSLGIPLGLSAAGRPRPGIASRGSYADSGRPPDGPPAV